MALIFCFHHNPRTYQIDAALTRRMARRSRAPGYIALLKSKLNIFVALNYFDEPVECSWSLMLFCSVQTSLHGFYIRGMTSQQSFFQDLCSFGKTKTLPG
jgi:hypothetical protein